MGAETAAHAASKQCEACQRVLPLDQFSVHPHATDGRLKRCRVCYGQRRRAINKAHKARTGFVSKQERHDARVAMRLAKNGHKLCSRCGTRKPVSAFKHRSNTKDGYQPMCMECHRAALRKGNATQRRAAVATSTSAGPSPRVTIDTPTVTLTSPAAKSRRRKPAKRAKGASGRAFTHRRARPEGCPDKKACTACGKVKTYRSFYTDRKNDDNLRQRCIDCELKGRKGKRRTARRVAKRAPTAAPLRLTPDAAPAATPAAPAALTLEAFVQQHREALVALLYTDIREAVMREVTATYILIEKP